MTFSISRANTRISSRALLTAGVQYSSMTGTRKGGSWQQLFSFKAIVKGFELNIVVNFPFWVPNKYNKFQILKQKRLGF